MGIASLSSLELSQYFSVVSSFIQHVSKYYFIPLESFTNKTFPYPYIHSLHSTLTNPTSPRSLLSLSLSHSHLHHIHIFNSQKYNTASPKLRAMSPLQPIKPTNFSLNSTSITIKPNHASNYCPTESNLRNSCAPTHPSIHPLFSTLFHTRRSPSPPLLHSRSCNLTNQQTTRTNSSLPLFPTSTKKNNRTKQWTSMMNYITIKTSVEWCLERNDPSSNSGGSSSLTKKSTETEIFVHKIRKESKGIQGFPVKHAFYLELLQSHIMLVSDDLTRCRNLLHRTITRIEVPYGLPSLFSFFFFFSFLSVVCLFSGVLERFSKGHIYIFSTVSAFPRYYR